jgi:hypothetical protein
LVCLLALILEKKTFFSIRYPVNCTGTPKGEYLNELVIHEIRNNTSAIFIYISCPTHKHHGLEMGCTSGDHEKGLLAPSCHCLPPRGGVFLPSHNKIRDTHPGTVKSSQFREI